MRKNYEVSLGGLCVARKWWRNKDGCLKTQDLSLGKVAGEAVWFGGDTRFHIIVPKVSISSQSLDLADCKLPVSESWAG